MSINKDSFLFRHLDTVVCFIIWAAGLVYATGVNNAKITQLTTEIHRIEADTSLAKETKWSVDQHTKDITDIRAEQKRQGDSISEIKSDVRLIAEWVKHQKDKQ